VTSPLANGVFSSSTDAVSESEIATSEHGPSDASQNVQISTSTRQAAFTHHALGAKGPVEGRQTYPEMDTSMSYA
jgi:hypothetical protein